MTGQRETDWPRPIGAVLQRRSARKTQWRILGYGPRGAHVERADGAVGDEWWALSYLLDILTTTDLRSGYEVIR